MLNAVVDLSHHNTVNDFSHIKEDGIIGIIHKATQGLNFVDDKYATRKDRAIALDLLWGAYHFGIGGNPIGQAEHFLNTVKPDAKTLLAVDFETNPDGATMTLAEAEQLVDHIHQQTGRWPLLYTSRTFMKDAAPGNPATILSNCPLWVASYQDAPSIPKQWGDKWTFWQYTNGVNGPEPHRVKGIVRCDRNQFSGTPEELRALWGA
jgi:GH25 family lysozyme M1 (1,4-beta-N-acetylmuramidase)